jgi:hypothetical protein
MAVILTLASLSISLFNFMWSRRQANIQVQYCQMSNEVRIKARNQSSTYTGRFRRKGQYFGRRWYWSLWERICEHVFNSEWLPRAVGISYGFCSWGLIMIKFFCLKKVDTREELLGPIQKLNFLGRFSKNIRI